MHHEQHAAGYKFTELLTQGFDCLPILEIHAAMGQVVRGPGRNACRNHGRRERPLAGKELAEEVARLVKGLVLLLRFWNVGSSKP